MLPPPESALYSSYQTEIIADASLRKNAASVFASAQGRQYWEVAGPSWRDNYPGRRAGRFYRVLDEAYREALTKPPSVPPTG
ncbi:MAG TPA: DUF6082 family protein [Pseudonocardiaceae bacterium]|jgi:hypothetical protein|nr:DUF6082 family protein [Pseudonocardiaceae bacterium]